MLNEFFEINTFHIDPKEGVQLVLVPERLRGETLTSTWPMATTSSSKPASASPRATSSSSSRPALPRWPCRTITWSAASCRMTSSIANTGELLATANDEINEDAPGELPQGRDRGDRHAVGQRPRSRRRTCPTRCASTPTKTQLEALVEIYRMMRPGEPPTKDAAQNLFHNLFFTFERYDLSARGPDEVQPPHRPQGSHRRLGAVRRQVLRRAQGRRIGPPARAAGQDLRHPRRHPRADRDPQRSRHGRRHRPPGQPSRAFGRRNGRERVPRRPGARRARRAASA